MRYAEIASKKLFEMPYLMAGSINWNLQNRIENKKRANFIVNSPTYNLVRDEPTGKLFRRIHAFGGEFAYITSTGSVGYFMEYRTSHRADFGSRATQVKVWRTISAGTQGLAADIFFNIMLNDFDTMISDRIQTEDGRRFWFDRLAQANNKGLKVGLIDHGKPFFYSKNEEWETWFDEVAEKGWGTDAAHWERLFFITKR